MQQAGNGTSRHPAITHRNPHVQVAHVHSETFSVGQSPESANQPGDRPMESLLLATQDRTFRMAPLEGRSSVCKIVQSFRITLIFPTALLWAHLPVKGRWTSLLRACGYLLLNWQQKAKGGAGCRCFVVNDELRGGEGFA